MDKQMDYIYKIFKGKSIKLTAQRKAIAKVFLIKNCRPLDAEAISKKLVGKADQATVFRNLEVFLEAGILRKVALHRDSAYYELSSKHHHHAICTKCGLIEETKCDFRKPNLRKFSEIKDHSMEFFGICKSCAKG